MRLIDANKLREDILTDKTNDPDVVNYYINMLDGMETQQAYTWIPITWNDEDTYPEPFTEVIFTDGDYINIGCCDSNGEWYSTNQENYTEVYEVKAWIPLPAPYKED